MHLLISVLLSQVFTWVIMAAGAVAIFRYKLLPFGMAAMESVAYIATTATLGVPPAVPVAGDPVSIRSFAAGKKAWLWAAHAQSPATTANQVQVEVKSSDLHDSSHGLGAFYDTAAATGTPTSGNQSFIPIYSPQPLTSQDILEVDIAGDGANPDFVVLHNYYEDLDAIKQNLIDTAYLRAQGTHHMYVHVQVTSTGSGTWEGGVAINSLVDQWLANRYYALLGITVSSGNNTAPVAVSIKGSDTGGVRLAVPGNVALTAQGARWFIDATEQLGAPAICTFNGSNKGNMIVECIGNVGPATYDVMFCFQLLGPK